MNSYNTDINNNIKKSDNYKINHNYHLSDPPNFVDAYIDAVSS